MSYVQKLGLTLVAASVFYIIRGKHEKEENK